MTPRRTPRPWAATLIAALLLALVATVSLAAARGEERGDTRELTLVHLSDTHGKLAPHWERVGGRWQANAGGMARTHTLVERVRRSRRNRNLLLVNGDNFASAGELFFTRGRAAVPIFNAFRIDAYTPGNWDFSDGPAEFRARFAGAGGERPLVNFPVLAAGIYNAPGAPEGAPLRRRVLPPYIFRRINGLKVAIIGLNDDKPIEQEATYTIGLELRSAFSELPMLVREVRRRQADLVVVMSEGGLAQNVALARDVAGIDVMLSADTHEETERPIVVRPTGTIVVESGEGNRLGQLDLSVAGRGSRARVADYGWRLHTIDSSIPESPRVKSLVDAARAPFLSGPSFTEHVRTYPGWRQGTGMRLTRPLDTVLGRTDVDLERHNVVSGTGDAVIADALWKATGADIAGTNGFRFDVGIPAGQEITLGDVFQWVPLGAHVAVGEMTGGQILDRFERFASSVLEPNAYRRGGGWLPRVAGARFYLDLRRPFGPVDDRIVRAEIFDRASGQWKALVEDQVYTIGSCFGPGDPLDRLCRTDGVRNVRFLTEDGTLAQPLIEHQRPNPEPKLQVAPDNVMSLPELMRRAIVDEGGVRGANHSEPTWIVVHGRLPRSRMVPDAVQPLSGSGPDWLAAERVEDER